MKNLLIQQHIKEKKQKILNMIGKKPINLNKK